MPKHAIVHSAGRKIEERLRDVLGRHFPEADLERVERLGGRITISLAVSDTTRRKRGEQVTIDAALVRRLEDIRNSPDDFHAELRRLTVAELRALSDLVGHPTRPGASAAEARAALLRHFQAEDVWRRISGPPATE